MTLWLISDTHFGHENMYSFLRADGVTRVRYPFPNAAEADVEMVRRWNEIVRPGDHVYHLGDVAIRKEHLSIVKHLNGRKRLVLGNHDIYEVKHYLAAGFQKVFGCRVLDGVLLTHIPVHPGSLHRFPLNVHGHIHEHDSPGDRYLNVSVERIGYRPITLEQAKAMAARRIT